MTDPFVRDYFAKWFNKPRGKFAPPPKFTKAELARVTTLFLANTQITDAGLKDIAKMQQLISLGLEDTKITDAGLKDIAKLQNLTVLSLGNTKITDDDVAELRKAMPNCDIRW